METTMNENIVPIISAIISLISAVYAVYLGKKIDNKNKQDEQSEWVGRLIEVATKSSKEFSEHEVLQIKSCLRPIKSKENSEWKKFTNNSIDYCDKLLEKRINSTGYKNVDNHGRMNLTLAEIDNCRLIANTLLKNHWEWMSYNNRKSIWGMLRTIVVFFIPYFKKNKLKEMEPILQKVNDKIS